LQCGHGVLATYLTRPFAEADIQHTVRYTELVADRFKDFWR
jgi:hypothetical protein